MGSSQETRKGPWVGEEVFSGKRVGRVTEGVCKWKWKKIGRKGASEDMGRGRAGGEEKRERRGENQVHTHEHAHTNLTRAQTHTRCREGSSGLGLPIENSEEEGARWTCCDKALSGH